MRNLVLVTVDCLRADHLGCYGYPRPTTPFLDRLSRDSWLFERPIVAGTPTYYSFPAILASRYPLALGRNVVGLAPGEATVASRLQEAGYATAGFVAGNPYLSTKGGYHEGLDRFEPFLSPPAGDQPGGDRRRPDPRPGWKQAVKTAIRRSLGTGDVGRSIWEELVFRHWALRGRRRPREMAQLRQYPAADEVIGRALDWLEGDAAEPFFLWVHLMDPHHPYFPPEEALAAIDRTGLSADRAQILNAFWNRTAVSRERLRRRRGDLVALYDAGIRWVDQQVGELAGRLRAGDRWGRTLFALTGDHGEEFLEHGGRYHHPTNLGSEVTRVPLLVHSADGGGRVPGLFSLIDLAPTLLDMLGVETPASFMGASRWRDGGFRRHDGAHAVTECVYDRRQPWDDTGRDGPRLVAIQNQEYKLVVNFATGVDQLFDLAADPQENKPLAQGVAREARRELLVRLREHLRRNRPEPRSRAYLAAQLAAIQHSLAGGDLRRRIR